MVVLRFGGTWIADAQPIGRAGSIVARQGGDQIVVVSALAGLTVRLVQVGAQGRSGRADAARVAALDGLTVHALARSASGCAVLFVLDDADLPEARERLHDRYGPPSAHGASS